MKRIWSAYIGRAATPYALTGAIPLLLAASTLSCWMSPLARIALPQDDLATQLTEPDLNVCSCIVTPLRIES